MSFEEAQKRIGRAKQANDSVLDLSNLKLSKLPSELWDLTNLNELNLFGNNLTTLPPEIVRLTNLTKLYLHGNSLMTLPPEIVDLTRLTELYLHGNCFTTLLPEITNLTNLTELSLAGNDLTTLPPEIVNLTNLTVLNLFDNHLTELPPEIGTLTNLTELYLHRNRFKMLPAEIVKLANLIMLDVTENPLETPPLEVATKGISAIGDYFRQLDEKGSARLFEAKFLIVGEAAAGKTTLARKVTSPEADLPTDDDSTKGIDITAWEFEIDNSDKLFRLNVWDFGGHQIYHATHQFFLTARSLYALVIDARKDHTDLDYWLNVVGVLSENSPLLIVRNEKFGRRPDIDEGRLRGRFSNIASSLPVDFKDNTGLAELREIIKCHACQLPHVGDKLPATWVNVRAELEKQAQSRNHISFEDYAQICRDNDIYREGDIAQLSGYLHDLGICLHFKDDPVLKHTVILKPEWCTDAVYQVLDNHDVVDNTGRFSLSNLDEIWDSPKYANMRDGLLRMMLNFKLCYEVPNRPGHYVAPQLLSHDTPQYDWDETDNLVLRFKYGFMPRGIIHRFIVAMNEDILGGDRVWRTGVVLDIDDTRAEVIEDRGSRTIGIRVVGQHRRDTMTVVAHELKKIHASLPGLKYEMHIPCNCEKCCDPDVGDPYFYKFKELRRFMVDGQSVIQCRNSYQMIPVRTLIDDTIDIRTIDSEFPDSKEGTMSQRDPQSGPVINLNVRTGDVSQEVSQDVKQEQTTNVQIDLKVDLPTLQGEFEGLLELLAGANPELRPRLTAVQDAIDELAPNVTVQAHSDL